MNVEEELRSLARRQPKLVALARRRIRRDELAWVLESLLDEGVSIRRLDVILEVLLDQPMHPLAAVRAALAPQIVEPHLDSEQTLHVIALARRLEEQIARGHSRTFLEELHPEIERLRPRAGRLVLLCSPEIRFRLRRWLRPVYPHLPVICWVEVPPGLGLNSMALLRSPSDTREYERFFEKLVRGGEPYRDRLLKRWRMA